MPGRPRLSRRTLLGAAVGVCAAAALGVWRWLAEPGGPTSPASVSWWPAASRPALETTASGPVTEATVAALVAAAGTVIGKPIEPSHYAEYFRWRAEHLPGYRTLYERFAALVDRDARRTAGRAFAACGAADRTRVLRPAARARDPRSALDVAWLRTAGRGWATYDRLIFAEALMLFADTDAWVLSGYDGWPGMPRGLDRYRRAPD